MPRNDFILQMVKRDLADQDALIKEEEKRVALLRHAGLPTAEAEERLERLWAIHMKYLEFEKTLDPGAAACRLPGRMH